MKPRVLQLIGSFHQGGSERQAISLTRLLKNDGTFDVFVATLNNEGALKEEVESLGLQEIPEFPLSSFYDASFVRQVRRCSQYLKENKIDIVHTHDFYTNVFGMAAATLAGIPARIASKRETGGMRSRAQEFIEKIAFGRAIAIVVNSEAVRRHLEDRSIPAGKVHVVYNGIDVDRFAETPIRREEICNGIGLPIPGDIKFVTIVANLRHPVKNIPMFLTAAKRIVDVVPAAHFVIAGEGELESAMRSLAEASGIATQTHFIGRCMDIPALLSISTACALTSTAEGFSNSILEYMAAAKPVVATDVGGAAEAIVDGETGFLVEAGDDESMAKHLIEILQDEERSKKMGDGGREVIKKMFSQTSQLATTLCLYNRVFDKNQ